MYDGKTPLLSENPINRHLINSPMLPKLKKNTDGSVTLYIQKDSPGKDKEANWLPAPNGPIYMVMRLYGQRRSRPRPCPPAKARGSDWQSRKQVDVIGEYRGKKGSHGGSLKSDQ